MFRSLFLTIFLITGKDKSKKKIIGYSNFDAQSKHLCSSLDKINKDDCYETKEKLKEAFFKYCEISEVKSIVEKKKMKVIRKPLLGRNKIAKYIFDKLESYIT